MTIDVVPPARRILERACRIAAYVGGAALMGVMAVVVVSVLGSNLLREPILGDTEIVDSLTGIMVFCFLPWCHLQGGNVIVDFFTRSLPQRARDWLDVIMNIAFALVATVLTWRLAAGGLSAYTRDQRSMFLAIPEWIVYGFGTVVGVLWIVVILYVAHECSLRARGRLATPANAGEAHFG